MFIGSEPYWTQGLRCTGQYTLRARTFNDVWTQTNGIRTGINLGEIPT